MAAKKGAGKKRRRWGWKVALALILLLALGLAGLYGASRVVHVRYATAWLRDLPPAFEGGNAVAPQQGAGMAVAKSDEQHEYASCEFLKWFTEKQNNLRFAATSSYLPVRTDANNIDELDSAIRDENLSVSPKTRDCIAMAMDSFDDVELYSLKSFDNAYAARKVLDHSLSDKATADKAAVQAAIAAGQSRAEALEPYVGDAAFEQWYASFCQQLQAAAEGTE